MKLNDLKPSAPRALQNRERHECGKGCESRDVLHTVTPEPLAFDAPHGNAQEAWMQVEALAQAYCATLHDLAMQRASDEPSLGPLDSQF